MPRPIRPSLAPELLAAAKGLSKEELRSMVQFGADTIFKSAKGGDEELTVEDIDAVLAAGEARTSALSETIAKKVGDAGGGGGLLDFKLDGSVGGVQMFEGQDYSTKARKEAAAALKAAAVEALIHQSAAERSRLPTIPTVDERAGIEAALAAGGGGRGGGGRGEGRAAEKPAAPITPPAKNHAALAAVSEVPHH